MHPNFLAVIGTHNLQQLLRVRERSGSEKIVSASDVGRQGLLFALHGLSRFSHMRNQMRWNVEWNKKICEVKLKEMLNETKIDVKWHLKKEMWN